MADTALDQEFPTADKLPTQCGEPQEEASSRPSPPAIREVDKIARAILMGVKDLMEFDGVHIPLTTDNYCSINAQAWIIAEKRGALPGAHHRSVQPPVTKPSQASAPSGGLDYDSQENPSQPQRNLYNLCIDRAEKHVMNTEGVMMTKARQTVRKFCATEYEDRYKEIIPTDHKLMRGPMSYLIDRLKDTYPLDLEIDKGAK